MNEYDVKVTDIKVIRTVKQKRIFSIISNKLQDFAINMFNTLDGHTTSRRKKSRLLVIFLAAVVTGCINAWQLYYKKHHGYITAKLETVAPDAMQAIYDYIQYIVDLYHIHKYDKEATKEYYSQYDGIDNFLGRQVNVAINKRLNKLIWFFTLIWITNVIYTSVCNREKGLGEILIHVSYHIFLLTKILTILSLVAHTLRIEYRLKSIGDIVEDCYHKEEGRHQINILNEYRRLSAKIFKSIPDMRRTRNMKTHGKIKLLKTCSYQCFTKITGLRKCYFILKEQCEFINNMFAIRILMHSLNLTIDMVRFINSTVRYGQGSQYNGVMSPMYESVVWSALRTFVPAAIFFSLVHHCERAYKEHHRIVKLSNYVIVEKKCEADIHQTVCKLRALAVSRPISITAANFFRFEYPLVTTVVATVTNYSIILFQSKS